MRPNDEDSALVARSWSSDKDLRYDNSGSRCLLTWSSLLAVILLLVLVKVTQEPDTIAKTAGIATFTEVECDVDISNKAPAFGASLILVANATAGRFYQAAANNFSRVAGLVRAATVDDIFIIQSVTKMVVVSAVLARGVDRNAMVRDICGATRCGIPQDFVDGFLANVTVEEIITHTSGIPDHESSTDATNMTTTELLGMPIELNPFYLESYLSLDPIDSQKLLQLVADYYLYDAAKPQKYSNTAYVVLGLLLEHVTGKDWTFAIDDFFADFVPNNGEFVCSTRYHRDFSPKVPVTKVVSAYKRLMRNDMFPYDNVRHDPSLPINYVVDSRMWSNLVSQGGMVCSLKSLTNFILALRAGTFPGVKQTDFVHHGTSTVRGGFGGTGVQAIYDTETDVVVVGTSSSGISGAFDVQSVLSRSEFLDCLY